MHPLAQRQLKRYFKGELPDDPRLRAFIDAVSDAYESADEDRRLLERTAELASVETELRNRELFSDIERRERRERAETERDAFFRTSPDMMSIVDHHMRLVQVNESWTRVLGYSRDELLKMTFLDVTHPDDRQSAMAESEKVARDGKTRDFECRQRHKDGTWRWVSVAGTMDAAQRLFYVVSRDVTETRSMARELAQAQKLEAVGQLASGVAHEINTPVQYVGDNVDFVAEGLGQLFDYLATLEGALTPDQQVQLAAAKEQAELDYFQEEMPRSLKEAREGVKRVAELVRALKEFAHPDAQEKTAANINQALERAITLARGELKHVCRVETEFADLPPLRCHIGGLSQVFLNLLVNAAHAVEERSAKHSLPFEALKISVATRVEGDELVISFTDTGCGIPDSIKERIFEPFFTTKPMGKGSGQGLPLVRNVVIGKHGGKIEVDSAVDVGTTFRLRLPIDPDDLELFSRRAA